MVPRADTLLPSPRDEFDDDDRDSTRSLTDVGAVAVLGAMVQQRKRHASRSVPLKATDDDDSDTDSVATQRRPRLDPKDDVFQKIR